METVAIINPKRRHRKRAAAKSNPKHRRTRRARRNDGLMTVTANPKRRRHHRGRKRSFFSNPSGGGALKIGIDSIGYTAAGAIAAKLVPIMLGKAIPKIAEYNKGFIGYGMQAAVGGALYFALDKFLKQKKAAQFILLGTAVSLATTILDDFYFKKQAATIKGLGFSPDEELAEYTLDPNMALSGALGALIDEEGNLIEGIGNYEEVPLDEQLLGLEASAAMRPAVKPRVSMPVRRTTTAAPAAQPTNGCITGRFRRRW